MKPIQSFEVAVYTADGNVETISNIATAGRALLVAVRWLGMANVTRADVWRDPGAESLPPVMVASLSRPSR